MCTARHSYGARGILTFRFGCREGLSARETSVERVPPRDPTFAALPAKVCDFIAQPCREIHESAMDIFDFASEGLHVVDVRLDRTLETLTILNQRGVGAAVLRRRQREIIPVIRLGVFDQLAQFPQTSELRIEPEEHFLEPRHEGVRLRHREQPERRIRVKPEIGRASHHNPPCIYAPGRALPLPYVRWRALRTARVAATILRSFAWASSTLRVLRPQSGSMKSFCGSKIVKARSIRSRMRDSGSMT